MKRRYSTSDKLKFLILKSGFSYRLLTGSAYRRFRKKIRENQKVYNSEKELFDLVNTAIRDVPFYRKRYSGLEVRSMEDFRQLEMIDKKIVADNFEEFISDKIKRRSYDTVTTSGTTGVPSVMLLPRNRYITEFNTVESVWSNAGFNNHVRGVFRNTMLRDDEVFRVNLLTREIVFNGFRMSEPEYLKKVWEVIEERQIQYIHAYTSLAYTFALFLKDTGRKLSSVKVFLCGSERVLPEYRELIEGYFKIRIFSWYGHSEKLIFGGECRGSSAFHIESVYGFAELTDKEGRNILVKGERGELAGTTLYNRGFPLIRYRTGDYAVYGGDFCPECGRRLLLLSSIEGRKGEKIYKSDNTFVTVSTLNLHGHLYTAVRGIQYFQKERGAVTVRLVKGANFTLETEREFYDYFVSAFGKDMKVDIQYADQLQRTKNNKSLPLISEIIE